MITLNMRAASACVNEFISRAFPFASNLTVYMRVRSLVLLPCEEEYFSEDAFTRTPNHILARGNTEPLLGMPMFKGPSR